MSRCARVSETAALVTEDPLPPLMVPVTLAPPPKAAEPAGRGGGGRPSQARARTPPSVQATPESNAQPTDTQSLLARVDLRTLGRATRDGTPGRGGIGPVGAGRGLGAVGTGSGAGGSGVQDLQPLHTPSPSFPRAAREAGLEALCTVTFHVSREGRTTKVGIEGCDEVFHSAIERAALQWRFEPRRVDGRREPATMTKRIRFVIH